MNNLADQTLILTGASLGMGRALARLLARESRVNLILNARHAAPLEEVAVACRAAGVQVRAVAGSAARESVAAALVAAARELGNFYGFIHAAGVLRPGPLLWELSPARFKEILDSHVTAAYQLVRQAVPELLQAGKGLAVFFGSGAAVSNLPGIGAYSLAKAAEEHLARQLAEEAPQITSFVFRPGVVDTRMQRQARQARGGGADILHRHFRAYKEQGELISPEAAARRLVEILSRDPRRYQGEIAK
jgi:NAD(P)-dependent dehydrogenase (short-subunit alcohol dehydrogenase family)